MPDVTRRSLRRVLSLVTASLFLASAGGATADDRGTFDPSSGPDVTPPVFVIPPMIVDITHESISVRVRSDEVASVALSYSDGDESIGQVVSLDHQTDHLIHVAGLTPETVYTVTIVMHDPVWNNSEEDVQFVVTLPGPDITPPVLIRPLLLALTHESVSMEVESDEQVTVVVTYSVGEEILGQVVSAAPQRSHTIALTDLLPETTYTLTFMLYDLTGNVSESVEQVITTKPIIVSVPDAVPTKFALYQNAPNPFNPSTTIRFDVAKSTPVNLTIYSTSGQLIRTLVDGVMTVGSHQNTWDGTDHTGRSVAGGVYLYRLQTLDRTASKRLTLVR
jgi:hypothetical protein